MSAALARVTAIGRAVDLRHGSNRYAVAASAAAGAVGGVPALLDGEGLAAAIADAVVFGFAAFAAWAVAREIDPDRTVTGALAAPFALAALLIGEPYLAAAFAVLVMGRITTRTTGLPLKPIDGLLVVGLGAYVATTPFGLIAVGGLGLAVALDAAIDGHDGWRRWLALAVLLSGIAASVVGGEWPQWSTPGPGAVALVVAAVVGAALMPREDPSSTCDHTGRPVDPARLRAGRTVTLVVALAYTIVGGGDAIAGLGPVFAAFAAGGAAAVIHRRPATGDVSITSGVAQHDR